MSRLMEDLAAYAAMGAASVALDSGIVIISDDDYSGNRAMSEPNFFQKKLTTLKRSYDDEDDMTIALLTTVWEDESIACIAESYNSKKPADSVPQKVGENVEEKVPAMAQVTEHSIVPYVGHSKSLRDSRQEKRQRNTDHFLFMNGFRTDLDSHTEEVPNTNADIGIQLNDFNHADGVYTVSNPFSMEDHFVSQNQLIGEDQI